MAEFAQFLFILLLPIGLVAGFLVAFFGLGGILYALGTPEETRQRIEAWFRRPAKPPRPLSREHYYRPWWNDPAWPAWGREIGERRSRETDMTTMTAIERRYDAVPVDRRAPRTNRRALFTS